MTKSVLIQSIAAFTIVAAILIVYFLFGSSKTEVFAEKPVSLPVVMAVQGDVTTFKSYPVSIEGEMDVEIRPQIEGYLSVTYVREGEYVNKGSSLFLIDDHLYQEQYNAAVANLAASEANLEKASIELDKSRELLANRVISEVQLRTVQADYKATKAVMLQNKAAVESARIRLEYTHIKAPVSGLVGRLPYRKGSLITPTNAEPLTLVSAVDKVRACFSISEQDYLPFREIYKEDSVKVSMLLADGKSFPHKGVIDAVNGVFEKNTGSIAVWAEFPNPEHIVRSGNTGSIQIEQRHKGILLLPQEATFRQQDKTLVYLVNDRDEVESRMITVEGKSNGQCVVTAGLSAGDRILSSGMNKVTEGMKIAPVVNKQ